MSWGIHALEGMDEGQHFDRAGKVCVCRVWRCGGESKECGEYLTHACTSAKGRQDMSARIGGR